VKKTLQILLPLALGIGILWWYISGFTADQWKSVKKALHQADYTLVIISLFLGLLSHLIRAWRWKYLLIPITGKTPRNINLVLAVGISYLINLGIPRSGEVARAGTLAKYEQLPFNKVMGTVIAERVADMIMLGLFVLLGFFLEMKKLSTFLKPYFSEQWILGGGFLLLTGLAGIISVFKARQSNKQFVRKTADFLHGILQGAMNIFHMKHKSIFLLETLLIWGLYLMMLQVVLLAFPETLKLSFGAIIFTFVAGSLSIVVSNGGIGTYPVFVTSALSLFGVPRSTGFAFSTVMWTSQTLLLIIMGIISLILLPVVNRKPSPAEANT